MVANVTFVEVVVYGSAMVFEGQVANAFGRGDNEAVRGLFQQGIVCVGILLLVFSFPISLFSRYIFELMGQNEEAS